MTLRSVHDAADVEWRVWDVRPSWTAPARRADGSDARDAPRPALAPP